MFVRSNQGQVRRDTLEHGETKFGTDTDVEFLDDGVPNVV